MSNRETKRAMLFNVSGSSVFICGTIHFLPAEAQIPQLLFDAVRDADDCFFESDLDHVEGEPVFARYPDGETIERHIPNELFTVTRTLCSRLNVPLLLPSLKPWFVTLFIGFNLVREARELGSGVDRQLWETAKQIGKTRFFLEEPNEGFRILDSSPMSEQIARLEFVVSNPERAVAYFDRLYAAWQIGDTVALTSELQAHLDLSPITQRSLIHDRNRKWLPEFLNAIECRRRAIFIVGVNHLISDNSLQRLLEEHGHTIQRVPL